MVKQLVLTALCACAITTSSQALVVDGHQEALNLKLTYPLVYVDEPSAQQAINTDIANYVEMAKAKFNSGRIYTLDMSYKTTYEDADYVSFTLTPYEYYAGAAHGMYHQYGLVYNKHTGERIPLSYFVHIKDGTQLMDALVSRVISFGTESGTIDDMDQYPRTIPYVSDEYVLLGNGRLALVYDPYELGAYALGATRLTFSPEATEYFNRRNHN